MKQSLLEMAMQTRQENTGSIDEHASVEGESVCRVPPLDKELQFLTAGKGISLSQR